jgi:hypothetical protein
MRTILGLNLVFLLVISASAQDRNFPSALGSGLPPLRPLGPHSGLNNGAPSRPYRGGFPVGAGYGYGFGGYGYAEPDVEAPPAVNNGVVFQPPVFPPPPPPPIHSSIQNVKGNPEQTGSGPPAFFVIVLKNGSQLTASVVWVQGDDARYVDSDGQGRRVPLADVDRAATREANRAHNLNLQLPPPAQ